MRGKFIIGVLASALLSAAIVWSMGELTHRAPASQANAWSPLTGQVSGLTLTTNYNNAFSALLSSNSGGSAPTNDQSGASLAGQHWLDTSTAPYQTMRIYSGTAWLPVGAIDSTNGFWIPALAGGLNAVSISGSTADLCGTGSTATPNNTIVINGSGSISSFGSNCPEGTIKFVVSNTATTLLDSASLIVPNGGSNVSVAAGDSFVALAVDNSGDWRILSYQSFNATGGVPSGTEAPFAGIIPPQGWTMEFGQALSRTTFANLFAATTLTVTGTPANMSSTISSVSLDLRNQGVEGAFVEGSGVPIGAYVSSVTATTIVLSTNATASPGAVTIRLLPWGQGDAATTFNIPDRRGVVIAGRDNMGGTAASRLTLAQSQGILGTKLGAGAVGGNIGGEQGHTQLLAEIAAHTHTITDPGHTHTLNNATNVFNNAAGGLQLAGTGFSFQSQTITANSNTTGITGANSAGSGTTMNTVQPTAISNWMIKN